MKQALGIVGILSLFIGINAFALPVSQCPRVLTLTLSAVQIAASPSDVLRDATIGTPEPEQVQNVEQAFANLSRLGTVQRTFPLAKAAGGRCTYGVPSPRGWSVEKAEIATSQGATKMYFQTMLGPKGIMIRTYAHVEDINPGRIVLSNNARRNLALAVPRWPYDSYLAGGSLTFVGQGTLHAVAR